MADMKPGIGVPTNWKEMRVAIVATLQLLANEDGGVKNIGKDDGYMSSDLHYAIERMFKSPGAYCDWMMTSPWGKAFERAMEDLREKGIVVVRDVNEIENRLAVWDQEPY